MWRAEKQEESPSEEKSRGGEIESERSLLPGGVSLPAPLLPPCFTGLFSGCVDKPQEFECVKLGCSGVLAWGPGDCDVAGTGWRR